LTSGSIWFQRDFLQELPGGFELDDNSPQQFLRHDNRDPSRLASTLFAFETSEQIAAGLAPSTYEINSVTFTARLEDLFGGGLLYEDSAPTAAGYLQAFQEGPINSQQAVELFGVGFRAGYEGFDLGTNPPATGAVFAESTSNYSGPDGSYVAFPTVRDAAGEYVDVSNNITGGFSATAPGNATAPFDAIPWAIGTARNAADTADLVAGDVVPNNSTFTFEMGSGIRTGVAS